MDSPDMEIEDDDYEPANNTKSPNKKYDLNNTKTENAVSIKTFSYVNSTLTYPLICICNILCI